MGDALSKPANEGLGPSDEVGAVLALRPGIIGTKRKAAEDAAGEVAVKRQQLLGLTMFTLATLRVSGPSMLLSATSPSRQMQAGLLQ